MWGKRSKVTKTVGHYDTLISEKTQLKGNILFSGGLHIDGKIIGNIRAEENEDAVVRISDVAEVRGDVHAPHIIVNGTVHGDVYASKHIELASAASVHGNVYYNLIEMAMGAEVNGQLVHQVVDQTAGAAKSGDKKRTAAGDQDGAASTTAKARSGSLAASSPTQSTGTTENSASGRPKTVEAAS